VFHKIRSDQGKKNVFELKEMYRVRNLTNSDLRRRHLLLNYRQVIRIIMSNVQQYKWWRTSTWRRLEAIKYRTLARKIPFILQNPIVASKIPHNSLSRSCSSLLVRLCDLKHPDASFSNPTTLSQLENPQGPLLRLRLRFLRLLKRALLPSFNKMVGREHVIMCVQQCDIFKIVCTNLRTWLNTVHSQSRL
jgi:hypothetical protein